MANAESEKLSFEEGQFIQELSLLENTISEAGIILNYKKDPSGAYLDNPSCYLVEALKEVSFIPKETPFDLTKISLNLYRTRDGYNHFYLSNIATHNQELVGLPGSVRAPRRDYFGVSWIRDDNGQLSYQFRSQHSANFIEGGELDFKKNCYAINVMASMFRDKGGKFRNERILQNPK
ncbi:MAG: hypothetical protein PHE21_01495 [Candidatus Dojkabacteria bacterium]|nr:hypothetical protein [Candidatus Dojkabacteria bacterium]